MRSIPSSVSESSSEKHEEKCHDILTLLKSTEKHNSESEFRVLTVYYNKVQITVQHSTMQYTANSAVHVQTLRV